MLLSQEFKDKIKIKDLLMIILNHLELFDETPERIITIMEKFSKLRDTMYATYEPYLEKAYNGYYTQHNKFPDINWLKDRLQGLSFHIQKGNYSESIYQDLIRSLDQEITRKVVKTKIVDSFDFADDEIDTALEALTSYRNGSIAIKRLTADEIENLVEDTEDEERGIVTDITALDKYLISLPNKSMSLINSPSGGGKTAIANTIMYNVALSGAHVIYVTFEATEKELWYNLASIESRYIGVDRSHTDWKHKIGSKEERSADYKKCYRSIRSKLNACGGYINILDFSTINETSFEDFCRRLENESERVGKKADLIIIDNVDGLGMFTSKNFEKDHMSAMNKKIIYLGDKYCKTYVNNAGTHIMMLSQTNRVGMGALEDNDESVVGSKKKKTTIDYRVVSDYSALYHKAKIALVCASKNENMRAYFIKNRDNAKPDRGYVDLSAEFKYSRIGAKDPMFATEEGYRNLIQEDEERKNSPICEDTEDFNVGEE